MEGGSVRFEIYAQPILIHAMEEAIVERAIDTDSLVVGR
jgi:hypothetical protein